MENEQLTNMEEDEDDGAHVTFSVMTAKEEMSRSTKASGSGDKHFRDSLRESIVNRGSIRNPSMRLMPSRKSMADRRETSIRRGTFFGYKPGSPVDDNKEKRPTRSASPTRQTKMANDRRVSRLSSLREGTSPLTTLSYFPVIQIHDAAEGV